MLRFNPEVVPPERARRNVGRAIASPIFKEGEAMPFPRRASAAGA
jgi:hypothetical protein